MGRWMEQENSEIARILEEMVDEGLLERVFDVEKKQWTYRLREEALPKVAKWILKSPEAFFWFVHYALRIGRGYEGGFKILVLALMEALFGIAPKRAKEIFGWK